MRDTAAILLLFLPSHAVVSSRCVFSLLRQKAKEKEQRASSIFVQLFCVSFKKGGLPLAPAFPEVLLYCSSQIVLNLFALFPSTFQAALVQAGRRGGGRRRQRGDEHQDAPHVRPWRARRGEQPLDCLSIFQTFTILD